MTTFLFNETNGTTLAQIDPNWQGSTSNIITSNGTISVDTRNMDFRAWYPGAYGSASHVRMQFERYSVARGTTNYPSLQATATRTGYTLSVWEDGRVYVDRNGSWGGYMDNLRNVFNPVNNDFILGIDYDESTGLLIGTINGVEVGRVVDGAPLTGGFPGFSCGQPTLAGDQSRNSAWSNDTVIAFPAPNTPSNLVATAVNPYTIGLTWADNSADEVAFVLEQESPAASGNWTVVTTTAANASAYTVTGLAGSTSYRYRLKADGYGPSSPYVVSNSLTTAPPIPVPAAPSVVSVSNVTEQSVDVVWGDTATNEDDYLVQVESPSGSGNWVNATTTTQNPLPAGATSATVTNLAGSTTYKVRVVARNLGGTAGATSSPFTTLVVTLPIAPTGVFVTLVTDKGLTVFWQDNSTNETGFVVQMESPAGQGNWTNATGGANPTAKNQTSFVATGLTPNTQYRFRVAATNSAGTSAYAVGANVTTKVTGAPYTWVFNQPDGTELTTIDSRFSVSALGTIVTNKGALSQNIRNATNLAAINSVQGGVQKSEVRLNVGATSTWSDPFVCGSSASPGYTLGFDSGYPAIFRRGVFVARGSIAVDTATAPYYYSVEFDSGTNTVTGKHNGVTVLTWADSTPLTGGFPGFSIGSIGSDPATTYPGPLLSWSDGVTPALAAPDAPAGVYVDTVKSTSATLHWTNGDLTSASFTIERTVVGSNVWVASSGSINPASPSDTFHIASALSSLTQYKFRVRANNSAGLSAWVESAPFTTEPLGLVTPMLTMYPF